MGALIEIKTTGFVRIQELIGKITPARNPNLLKRSLTRIILTLQKEVTTSGDFIKHGRGNAAPLPDVLTSRKGGAGLVGSITPDYSHLPYAASLGSDLPYAGRHEDSKRAYLLPSYLKLERTGRPAEIAIGVFNEEIASA